MGDRVAHLRFDESTLAARLADIRTRLFVGRDAEQAAFEQFVAPESPLSLWFVVGAGGVGKSTLLQQIHARAPDLGLTPVWIDARHTLPNPPAVRHALSRACDSPSFAAFCAEHARPVLFIDTFEYWRVLESWFSDEFLPELPASLKLIVGSRTGPGLEWRADEGWRALMQVSRLKSLPEQSCVDYLARRGVAPEQHAGLIGYTGGHPLALAMGADSVLSGRSLLDASGDADDRMIAALVESFTREARSDDERRALDACTVVRQLNESLLAALLGRSDVVALYQWLQQLAFMETDSRGVRPHDLVRDVLMREMSEHNPGRYEALAQAAFAWTVDRIEAADTVSWPQAAAMAADGMYALRALPMVQHFLQPTGTPSLYLDRARAEDQPALMEMVRTHEGAASARWFEYWCDQCPASVYVIRGVRESPRGYFVKLELDSLAAEVRDRDPLTRHLWQALSHDLGLKPGESAPFIRFWGSVDAGQSQSPEKTQILMAIHTYNLMAGNLRITAQVFDDTPSWPAQARALGIDKLADSETVVGDRVWCIYYHDWQRESPAAYYRRFAKRCIDFEAVTTRDVPSAEERERLSEADFRAALGQALKHWQRNTLCGNSLLTSALVAEHAGVGADEQSRVDALMHQVTAATERLGAAGERGRQWQRVLDRAYLAPARDQRQAAESLNMGYSTFRRQLANARRALAGELWRLEQAAR